MKVYGFLRAAVLSAVILGAAGVDAKRSAKTLCDADPAHPVAPTPVAVAPASNPGLKGSVTPVATPATTAVKGNVAVAASTPAPAAVKGATVAPTTAPVVAPASPAATTAKEIVSGGGAATVGPAKEPTSAPASTPAPAPASTPAAAVSGAAQTKAGSVKSKFSYTGKDAGGPGSYDMVTDFGTCAKAKQSTSSPVSPLDDDVTIVFRGPMNIHNIAVFDGSSGAWNKVSSYAKGGAASNLVFLNNRNIDFGGKSSPQGFSNADGTNTASQSTPFAGNLGAASNPYGQSIYADEKTGAEVHIMTGKQCGKDGECKGYYDKDGTAFQGWGGAKKMFVTKVTMPNGGSPNLPAIWMLNAQIVRSSQYGCNCRGMGKGGGCGELDIAEVLEKDTSVVATHYYFYDGGSAPGHDSFGKRPYDTPATYITIIDESYGVKILELGADDFDFSSGSVSQDVVSQWLKA
ncbi:Gpi anchor protein [Globisporangium polare]